MFERIAEKFQDIFKGVRGEATLNEKNISRALREIKLALLDADVHYRVVKELMEQIGLDARGEKVLRSLKPGQQFIKIFHDRLVEFMDAPDAGLKLSGSPSVILLAGLQGAGKTTAAAKLAFFLRKERKLSSLLAATDLRRPAAAEQLKILGEKIGVETFGGKANSPLKIIGDAIEYARSRDLSAVIVDTAGRLHIDGELMAEVAEIREKFSPDETLLVLDAMTGQDAVQVALEFNRQVAITGSILTKLDGDARGGAAISLRAVTGRPIKLVGVGEKPEDLVPFDPERIVSRILGMGDIVSLAEKAQAVVDVEEAEKWEKKWKKAAIDLEDFRVQLRGLKKIGSWESIVGMLPAGMAGLEDGSGRIKRMEAILDSMTPGERARPEMIDGSRRERVAKGSGTSVPEVNQMLKQFKLLKKMMVKAGGMKHKKLSIGGANWPL
jgi:signal recognition particle subunit SRP54